MDTPLFKDFSFPSELYTRDGHFTHPIQTFLNYAPILIRLRTKQQRSKRSDSTKSGNAQEDGSLLNAMKSLVLGAKGQEDERQQLRNWDGPKIEEVQEPEAPKQEQPKRSKKRSSSNTNTSDRALIHAGNGPLVPAQTFSSSYHEKKFLQHYYTVTEHVQHLLQSAKAWIQARESHGHTIPNIVRTDIMRLERLINLLHKIDSHGRQTTSSLAVLTGATAGMGLLTTSAYLSPNNAVNIAEAATNATGQALSTTLTSTTTSTSLLSKTGLGLLVTSVGLGLGINAYYSSEYYQKSLRTLITEAKWVLEAQEWKSSSMHSDLVLTQFDLPRPAPVPVGLISKTGSMASVRSRNNSNTKEVKRLSGVSKEGRLSSESLVSTVSSWSTTSTLSPRRLLNPVLATFFE